MKVTQHFSIAVESETIVKKDIGCQAQIILVGQSGNVTLKFEKNTLPQIMDILTCLEVIKQQLVRESQTELEVIRKFLPKSPSLPQITG